MNALFNRKRLLSQRVKLAENINNSEIMNYIAQNFIEHLEHIDNSNFKKILNISDELPFLSKYLKEQYPEALLEDININDEMDISSSLKNNQFDLITYSFGLHWINDVIGFLAQIYDLLNDNGIFICSFAGDNSLRNLRKLIIEIESANSSKYFGHISPFIKFDQVTDLAKKTGFQDIIVDYENLELEDSNPIKLMKMIKNIGESSNLINKENYQIPKNIFKELEKIQEQFNDRITLISLVVSKKKGNIKVKR